MNIFATLSSNSVTAVKPRHYTAVCILLILCSHTSLIHAEITDTSTAKAETTETTETTETNETGETGETTEATETDETKTTKSKPNGTEHCDRTKDQREYDDTWYDVTHDYVNMTFCEPAAWFDDFFGSDRVMEEVPGTYVRWQNDFIYNEEEGFSFKTNLRFSVELPKITTRLKLTFDSDEDQALQDVAPGGQAEATTNTLGLRFDVKDTDRHNFNISANLKPRIRLRYRYALPLTDTFLFRFTQEVQREKSVNGALTRIDFEKAFLPSHLLRATTEGRVAEDFEGVDWLQTLVLYQRLSRKASISYEGSVIGITEPESMITNYRLGIRYRRNIHRDWLFFEITPDMTWPITLSEDRTEVVTERRSVASIFVRLEVHFGNAQRKKYSDYAQRNTRPEAEQFVRNNYSTGAVLN